MCVGGCVCVVLCASSMDACVCACEGASEKSESARNTWTMCQQCPSFCLSPLFCERVRSCGGGGCALFENRPVMLSCPARLLLPLLLHHPPSLPYFSISRYPHHFHHPSQFLPLPASSASPPPITTPVTNSQPAASCILQSQPSSQLRQSRPSFYSTYSSAILTHAVLPSFSQPPGVPSLVLSLSSLFSPLF